MLQILFPNCIIQHFEIQEKRLVLKGESVIKEASCPNCKVLSRRVHGYYQRHPDDLPLVDFQISFKLRVKRFICLNESCKQKTFAVSFEPWLARYAQRSKRLTAIQTKVVTALSAKASEDLLTQLQMPISHDTALNLIYAQALPAFEMPKVLGVDDFAIRKRNSYGTILIDLEEHKVIDVLADRSSATLIDWFEQHQGIKVISRDRSQDYKTACDTGAPKAIQVADRWHLHKNLGDVLKRWFERHKKRLLKPLSQDEKPIVSESLNATIGKDSYERKLHDKLSNRNERIAKFEEAKRLREEGFSLPYIAHELKMGKSTLSRWFSKHGFPDKQRTKLLEPFMPYLKERYEEGVHNKMQLYREIVSQGFEGSHGNIYSYFASLEAGFDEAISKQATTLKPLNRFTAFKATRLFSKAKDDLEEKDKQRLEQMFRELKEAEACYDLVQRFLGLFKMSDKSPVDISQVFDTWLKDAQLSNISEIARFAKGLSNDQKAIEAALTLPWSNGPVEGKITKLKLIKRQMYGRASFELLRRRVLLNA